MLKLCVDYLLQENQAFKDLKLTNFQNISRDENKDEPSNLRAPSELSFESSSKNFSVLNILGLPSPTNLQNNLDYFERQPKITRQQVYRQTSHRKPEDDAG
jgi:hypothetical protein